jgi:DNA-binding response OmpR family regulator
MSTKRFLLVAEHDAAVRELLVEQLEGEQGFTVAVADTLSEADIAIKTRDGRFDAVILDVGMPDGDGCDYCASLRRQGHEMPIIMLTGRTSEADVVRGLDAGANDYVAKPFRINELLARLRAQWRICDGRQEVAFSLGPYTFRPAAKALYDPIKDSRIPLTAKEVAILKFLILSDGRPVDRPTLLREVWGYNPDATTHTVETHIHRLRRKIELHPKRPELLLNRRGGYRLNLTGGVPGGT